MIIKIGLKKQKKHILFKPDEKFRKMRKNFLSKNVSKNIKKT